MSMKKRVLIIIVVILVVAGLYEWSTFFPKKITNFYNNTPSRISHIVIRCGNTGKERTIEDKDKIKLITNYLNSITMKKQNPFDKYTGWTYNIDIYEGGDEAAKVCFVSEGICSIEGNRYAITNDSDLSIIDICDKEFGRDKTYRMKK